MRRKNQIPEYYNSSPKGYNKEDTKLIDEKLPNPVGELKKEIEKSQVYFEEKLSNLQVEYFLERKSRED